MALDSIGIPLLKTAPSINIPHVLMPRQQYLNKIPSQQMEFDILLAVILQILSKCFEDEVVKFSTL